MKRKLLIIAALTTLLSTSILGSYNAIGADTKWGNKIAAVNSNSKNKINFSANIQKSDAPSYIYVNGNNIYNAVSAGKYVYVQKRDSNLRLISQKSFSFPGSKFAGYYFDGTYHYIISANDKERKNTDLYLIDKYDDFGNKLGKSAVVNPSQYENNDTGIFDVEKTLMTGGVDIKVNGNIMSIIDSVQLKKKDAYGIQANALINYRMDYSFASFLSFARPIVENYPLDKSAKPYVTYGPENYISFCWEAPDGIRIKGTEYSNIEENDKIDNSNIVRIFETFEGKNTIDDNITLDGFEVSETHYIVSGTSVTQDSEFKKNSDQNVFISTVEKSQPSEDLVRTKFLTQYTNEDGVSIERQQLVKIDDNNFVLLWQENKDEKTTVKYTSITADGKTGNIKENEDVTLSNCEPVYINDKIVWFNVEENAKEPKFFTINL